MVRIWAFCWLLIEKQTVIINKHMKNYTDIEKIDAESINEINSSILKEKNNWDKIYNDLNNIYNHIPDVGYLNNFEENGTYYHKFWDQEEFISFSHHLKEINDEKEVVWIGNAYPKCCYFLAIISIERGDFKEASEFLQKGIELEPDNPMLLSELGLLHGQIGTNTGEKDSFNQAIYYYDKAFNSRPFNTDSQKARALRGIGFILIELGEFKRAKELYEASLTWEESNNARNELEIIAQQINKPEGKIISAGSNFNDAQEIYSNKYFDETRKKLPNNLKSKIPSKYAYIWSKASRLLAQGFSEYRKNDFFNYPLIEWNESEITKCISQIVHYLKGFAPSHYIETKNIENAKELLLTFHFDSILNKQITNKENQKIQEITFKHKVDKDEIIMYFRTNYSEEPKKKWWKLW